MTDAPDLEPAALEACPFCDGEPQLIDGGPGNFYVRCVQCNATGDDGSRDYALSRWNRRAARSAPEAGKAVDETLTALSGFLVFLKDMRFTGSWDLPTLDRAIEVGETIAEQQGALAPFPAEAPVQERAKIDAITRLRENIASFDAEVAFQLANEGERADLWTEIDVNVEDLRVLLRAVDYNVSGREVGWLIERKYPVNSIGATEPRWYAERENGDHRWTPVPNEAKRFATRAEAEAYPSYQMIASDPTISITEHVWINDGFSWSHGRAALASVPAPSGAEPMAWMVLRKDNLHLPVLTSREDADKYQLLNPEETLQPLYASPQPVAPTGEIAGGRTALESDNG